MYPAYISFLFTGFYKCLLHRVAIIIVTLYHKISVCQVKNHEYLSEPNIYVFLWREYLSEPKCQIFLCPPICSPQDGHTRVSWPPTSLWQGMREKSARAACSRTPPNPIPIVPLRFIEWIKGCFRVLHGRKMESMRASHIASYSPVACGLAMLAMNTSKIKIVWTEGNTNNILMKSFVCDNIMKY